MFYMERARLTKTDDLIYQNISVFISAKYILYSHNKFNDWVPQRLEVDEQHCNEVTQRDLEENGQKKDTTETSLLSCPYMYYTHVL